MGDCYRQQPQLGEAMKGFLPEKGLSGFQAPTVAALLPVSGSLLALAGLLLIGLAVLTLLFSPVLVPAALLAALAVAGFLGSSTLGLAGFSPLGCLLKKVSPLAQKAAPEQMEQARRRVGQKAKDAVQSRAEEAKRT